MKGTESSDLFLYCIEVWNKKWITEIMKAKVFQVFYDYLGKSFLIITRFKAAFKNLCSFEIWKLIQFCSWGPKIYFKFCPPLKVVKRGYCNLCSRPASVKMFETQTSLIWLLYYITWAYANYIYTYMSCKSKYSTHIRREICLTSGIQGSPRFICMIW